MKCLWNRLCFPKPSLHFAVLVRAVVVGSHVYIEVFGHFPVNLLEETEPLQVGVLLLRATNQLALQIAHGGNQADRAVPVAIVRAGLHMPDTQRQSGLRVLQCLALGVLVAAQHH